MLHTLRLSAAEPQEVERLAASFADAPLSYHEGVGLTQTYQHPPKTLRLQTREVIGRGPAAYAKAQAALEAWELFDLGWVAQVKPSARVELGALLSVEGRFGPLRALNFGRILYLIDERDARGPRFGFGFGTLPRHILGGEERFTVGHDLDTDEVWFEVMSFSKPVRPESWLVLPLLRAFQRRFLRASAERMRRAVGV